MNRPACHTGFGIALLAFAFAIGTGGNTAKAADASPASAGDGRKLFRMDLPYSVDGKPILGTYVADKPEELALVKDVGMNVVLGGEHELDPASPTGKYCRENGIKVMHHLTQHLYGKPRLGDAITADATTIPLLGPAGNTPESGVVQIEDERIRYAERTATELRGCRRGCDGTKPAAHHAGIILFFPEACAAEIKRVKDSPNLWGYYVLDDSPGDALSALRAMYKTIREIDPDPKRHPVCAGFGSAGSLCNFGPGVCDIMLIYWYPVSDGGYHRRMTSHEVQWMLGAARARVPGVPFIGVYQTFNGGNKRQAVPTAAQLREQLEDFVREGACGLVAFLCRGGWADHKHLRDVIHDAHREILSTGGLRVAPEPEAMRRARVQPTGNWKTPRQIPGVVPAWHVIGPFDDTDGKILGAVFPPEKKIDLKGVYSGKLGKVRWIPRLSHGGVVGLGELVGSHLTNAADYALCTVTSPRQQNVQMRIGSDNDAIVWLNGKEIWRYEGARGIARDDDIVDIALPAGPSQILFKCYNRGGMWALFMRFTDRNGQPLEGLQFSPSGK